MATRYELLYIIPATVVETEVGAVETKMATLLTKYGATVELTKRLGKLHLAYPIDNQRYGYYVAVVFTAEAPSVAKLEENLRISNDILRHMISKSEKTVEEQKFDLVQFVEINVEEERARRREKTDDKKEEDKKEGEKTEKSDEEKSVKEEDKTAEVLAADKKLDEVVEGEAKTA